MTHRDVDQEKVMNALTPGYSDSLEQLNHNVPLVDRVRTITSPANGNPARGPTPWVISSRSTPAP